MYGHWQPPHPAQPVAGHGGNGGSGAGGAGGSGAGGVGGTGTLALRVPQILVRPTGSGLTAKASSCIEGGPRAAEYSTVAHATPIGRDERSLNSPPTAFLSRPTRTDGLVLAKSTIVLRTEKFPDRIDLS